jgi:uncharacterized protein YbjT (DUF2867 family)
MKVVINTPTGNIGRRVVDALLNGKHEVTVISRDPNNVTDAVGRGAVLVHGSIDDPSVVDRALHGADALFWVTPIAFDQPDYVKWATDIGVAAADIARRNSVPRAVVLSTVGSQERSRSGFLECLWHVEQAFANAVPDVTVLRPGAFMENLLNNVSTIAGAGAIFGRYPASRKIPMVATRDIAEAVIEVLSRTRADGFRVFELHGPEDLDQTQVADVVGRVTGRQLRYQEVTEDQARQGMLGAGMPGFFVDLMMDMYAELQAGRMERSQTRTAMTTSKTTLDVFAREVLKPAIEATLPHRTP